MLHDRLKKGLQRRTWQKDAGETCVAGSLSYEFYNYKMKTEYGDCELNGTATFKNVFTPMLSEGMCHIDS